MHLAHADTTIAVLVFAVLVCTAHCARASIANTDVVGARACRVPVAGYMRHARPRLVWRIMGLLDATPHLSSVPQAMPVKLKIALGLIAVLALLNLMLIFWSQEIGNAIDHWLSLILMAVCIVGVTKGTEYGHHILKAIALLGFVNCISFTTASDAGDLGLAVIAMLAASYAFILWTGTRQDVYVWLAARALRQSGVLR